MSDICARKPRAGPLAGADAATSQPRFMVLGPLEVRQAGGEEVSLGPPLHRQVLATLLMSADVPRDSSWLPEAVWGEQPPGDPASSLRTAVKCLRKRLGVSARHLKSPEQGYSYMFSAEDSAVDAVLFAELADSGRAAWYGGDARHAAELLAAAAGLWREPVLADVPATAVLKGVRDKLLRGREDVESLWLDARLALGGHREAVSDIRQILARDPLRVHAWAQLMLALHRCGDDDEALQAFSEAHAVFLAEYGTDPGPELAEIRHVIAGGGGGLRPPGAELALRPDGAR